MPIVYLSMAALVVSLLLTLQLNTTRSLNNFSQISFWLLVGCIHGLFFKPLFFHLGYPQELYYSEVILFDINRDVYWSYAFSSLIYYSIFLALIIVFTNIFRGQSLANECSGPRYNISFPVTRIYLVSIIPIVALYFFINKFGLYGLTGTKNDLANSSLDNYSSGTSLRILIWMFYLFAIMSLSNIVVGYRKTESKVIFLVSFVAWLFFCIISDARGLLLFSLLGLYSFHVYTGVEYKTATKLSFALIASVFIFLSTANRIAAEGLAAFEGLVSNIMGRNLIEISKGAHIHIAADDLGYSFGGEIINTLLLYIPRELYPEKKVVSADTYFGMEVFGCEVYGACAVPPGLLGEALFSFDWAGAAFMMILLSFVFGLAQQKINSYQLSRSTVLMYFSLLLFAGLEIAGSGYTSFLRQFLVKMVIVLILTSGVSQATRNWNGIN